MSSVVISGDTSGAITLSAPAVSGTNTATLPAATGTVMVSGNMPAFSAYLVASQSVTSSVFTKSNFDTEEFDTNNNFTSSRFTPTVAGYYQINGAINLSGTTISGAIVSIYKNGTEYKRGTMLFATFTNVTVSNVSSIVYFNGTTDYVELYGYVTATTTPAFGAGLALTYFNGTMVRSA